MNEELENLYDKLSILEESELFAIDCGNMRKLRDIREKQKPIKQKINELENEEIYSL